MLAIGKSLPVSSAGAFAFTGRASAYIHGVKTKVPVTLTGRFTTPASASVGLSISYADCKKPLQLMIKAD